jgi:putative peptidoglycan lipid II flippase
MPNVSRVTTSWRLFASLRLKVPVGPGSAALLGTVVGSAPGFMLPFAVAAQVGVGRVTDTYVLALALSTFVIAIASGVIENNVLPAASLKLREGGVSLLFFARRTAAQGAGLGLGLYCAVAIAGEVFVRVRPGWSTEQQAAFEIVLAELGALVALVAFNSALAAALYALGDFLVPTASQAIRSLTALSALPLLGSGFSTIKVLPAALVAGEAIRMLLLRYALKRKSRGRLNVGEKAPGTVGVWRVAAPHAINMVVLAANPIIDRVVAATLGPGDVTILDLGERLYFIPVMIMASSVVLVSGARWAAMSVDAPAAIWGDYQNTLRRIAWLSGGLVVGFGALSWLVPTVVAGSFGGRADTFRTVSSILLLALLPASAAAASGRLLTALRHTRPLPVFAVAAVSTNLVADIGGARLFGLVGIAVATVLAQAGTAVLLVAYCRRLLARRSVDVYESFVET